MTSLTRSLLVLAAAAAPLAGQAKPPAAVAAKPPMAASFAVANLREGWQEFVKDVTESATDMPADKYSFTPVAGARTFGQIIAHVAGSSYMFCGAALGDAPKAEDDIEKTMTTKDDLVAAMKASTAYCAKAYAISDAASRRMIKMFGSTHSKLWALMINLTHDAEQYGNLLPYLRMNGLTPPSSKPSH